MCGPFAFLEIKKMSTTQNTIDLMKGALAAADDALSKTVSTGTGLVAYDLQAPAKNLYPVNTPIRNIIPRVSGGTGLATNWRQVSAITGSGFDGSGWVPEGQRSGRMSYTTANKAATYVTLGEEDQVTFEAVSAARTFEDIQATATMRMMQKLFLKEESALLGGNTSLALGTTPTPTLSAAGSGATLPAATYSVICVALTYEGFRNSSLAGGVATSLSITGADGQTYTLNGGSAQKSSAGSQAVTLGQTLSCSVAAVRGAVAYAWFIGASGSEKLEKITTINSTTFSAALVGTYQAASALTAADYSRNTTVPAFDGLLTNAFISSNGAYFNSLATGTAGTGTSLTSSNRGSIVEIDTMLQAMWDNYQVSPTAFFVNSQELKNITTKVLTNGSGPLLQYFADPSVGARVVAAGGGIEFYYNPFCMGSGIKIPIMIHPNVPAGTIVAYCDNLPAQYLSNNVPNVAEVKTRVDYYQIDWPLRTRAREFGVYTEQVLAVYAPFTLGVITNIANG